MGAAGEHTFIGPGEWAPVIAALASLGILIRWLLRYERTFVSDARDEIERLRDELDENREEIKGLRAQVTKCRSESHLLQLEVDRLRRLVES